LAAPHSYGYDAVNLIPALIWVLAEFLPFSTDAIVRRRAWTIVALWYASMSAAFVRPLLPDVVLRAGNLAVWIAIALAVCLWRTVHAVPVGDAPTSRAQVRADREFAVRTPPWLGGHRSPTQTR
jgi:hypothetical protein